MTSAAASRTWASPLAVAAVLGALAAAAFVPLLAYSLSLAVFGLAHVLYELRYVDGRFGRRLGSRLRWTLAAGLTALVAFRALGVADVMDSGLFELGFGCFLAAAVVPAMGARGIAAALLALAIAAGMFLSPLHTFLVIAVLHNLTPVAFLAEARSPMTVPALLVFVGGPLLVASGMLQGLAWWPEVTVLPTGTLEGQLGAFLPPEWHDRPWAAHAFSGVVFAQLMHYAVVIHVLPGLPQDQPLLLWPRRFPLFVALLTAPLLAAFAWWSFKEARALYGIAATLHAWVEVPILLLALAPTNAE